jgi:hypothetical protein
VSPVNRLLVFSKERKNHMTVHLIAYDLNREVVRPNITAEVKKTAWAKLSESSYAVDTTETPAEVYARFKPLLDSDDNLYVTTLKKPYHGWGPPAVIDWLDQRLTY